MNKPDCFQARYRICPGHCHHIDIGDLIIRVCPHWDLHYFKKHSPLMIYLKLHCPVWEHHEESKVSVNYVTAFLSNIIASNNLDGDFLIKPDTSLRIALNTSKTYLTDYQLRNLVMRQLDCDLIQCSLLAYRQY